MEKLQKFLKENRISEADAIERIRLQDSDPAKDFYSTKSLKLAKLEAYPEKDIVDESVSFLDRISSAKRL